MSLVTSSSSASIVPSTESSTIVVPKKTDLNWKTSAEADQHKLIPDDIFTQCVAPFCTISDVASMQAVSKEWSSYKNPEDFYEKLRQRLGALGVQAGNKRLYSLMEQGDKEIAARFNMPFRNFYGALVMALGQGMSNIGFHKKPEESIQSYVTKCCEDMLRCVRNYQLNKELYYSRNDWVRLTPKESDKAAVIFKRLAECTDRSEKPYTLMMDPVTGSLVRADGELDQPLTVNSKGGAILGTLSLIPSEEAEKYLASKSLQNFMLIKEVECTVHAILEAATTKLTPPMPITSMARNIKG